MLNVEKELFVFFLMTYSAASISFVKSFTKLVLEPFYGVHSEDLLPMVGILCTYVLFVVLIYRWRKSFCLMKAPAADSLYSNLFSGHLEMNKLCLTKIERYIQWSNIFR